MSYYFTTILHGVAFDDAIAHVTEALMAQGFGVLTEIDVSATLKKKIDVDFRPYRILGACNPVFAHQALQHEDKIGVFLPCSVVVQQREGGDVEVSAVDPVASMMAVHNPELESVATQVRARLQSVIEGL